MTPFGMLRTVEESRPTSPPFRQALHCASTRQAQGSTGKRAQRAQPSTSTRQAQGSTHIAQQAKRAATPLLGGHYLTGREEGVRAYAHT